MKLHNPLPENLDLTCKKATSILEHFIKGHNQLDHSLIPQSVLKRASGIAIITIVKAGVLWSGRAGTGLVVARLADGSWSPPSAIFAGGVGIGAQFGAQITDVVFVLNNYAAVKAFSHGNLTLGGNISVAAGPTGRSSEAAGAVIHAAPVYSYSKSKGLFAGVSLEGTVILTRKKANAKMYGKEVSAFDILQGKVPKPPAADPLYRMLNIKFGKLGHEQSLSSSTVNDPRLSDPSRSKVESSEKAAVDFIAERSNTLHNQQSIKTAVIPRANTVGSAPPPIRPKPASKPKQCIALYDYSSDVEGDLSFKKGDLIWISKNLGEWTEGSKDGKKGIFPTNYVEI